MSLLTHHRFDTAWLADGWRRNVVIGVDLDGNIASVRPDDASTDAPSVAGAAIPGMPNVHSHAFQRAMAGLAERRSGSNDSFWTWRETMYELARRMTPTSLNAIAAQLYVEMLKAGYTTVCEFHYLHHHADGTPYEPRGSMAHAVLDAAASAGIGMTLLPTLYCTSDFGSQPPTARQRQFINDASAFLAIVDELLERTRGSVQADVGIALHSLRAVPPEALDRVVDAMRSRNGPIHIHIAEQEREVAECLRHHGQRPVEWLLDHVDVDARWCLVHATHTTLAELDAIARSGASVALCPTTEGNLGDGLFDLPRYLDAGGIVAIGSDSHISVSPVEELRWIEYQARLARRERNVLAAGDGSTGSRLWRLACNGGERASGRRVGLIAEGYRADLVVLDLGSPALFGREADSIIDTFVFSGQQGMVRDVMAGGRWVVQDGRHFAEETIAAGYRRAVRGLE